MKREAFCLAIGQRTHSLLLWNWIILGRWLCKLLSLLSDTCPSLRCQRYGLERTGTVEIECTRELKTDYKMEEALDIDVQSGKACSK